MDKPRVAIISTSINAEPPAYAEWVKHGDLIVAGDENTPRELRDYLSYIGGLYLPPSKQSDTPGTEHIGWRNIQRRNAALWFALTSSPRYDYIASVDDDNFPCENWADMAIANMASTVINVMSSRSGFLNTGNLCHPQFTQRGTPRGVDTRPYVISLTPGEPSPTVVVHQSQVLGDPDCDAIQRLTAPVLVERVLTEGVVQPGINAAFNSQATMWAADYAPLAAVMPGVGRFDDILAAFIFHRIAREYNVALFVGNPVVTQRRNEHNLIADLRAELWSIDHVFDVVATLRAAHISRGMALVEAYGELITALRYSLPDRSLGFAQDWFRAWRKIA